ncbi:MAG: biotin--[acetyl-CoA-carboxylase] ligase [Candidatus Bathyarchaeota archaeon]|nr:MAG: biotin--[acetyl-CoA-carboxylase] ligase [Candidatus Bathyarchaeota archaeon]
MPRRSWIHPEKIKKGLKTDLIGQRIQHFTEATSTNDIAKKLASKGAEEGTVVISETQTLGRGRLSRRWASPRGGIWLSTVLRPQIKPKEAPKLTLVAAVVVAQTIKEIFGLNAEIKWPNDVLIKGRKVCGILTETSIKGETIDFAVVGIGINANTSLDSFPERLRGTLTSLKKELGEEIDREDFLRALFEKLEHYYRLLEEEKFDLILQEWRSLGGFLGQHVEVISLDEKIVGQAVDVNQNGKLVIKLEDGSERKVTVGDVIIRTRLYERETD